MNRPESPEHGVTFELASIAQDLRAEAAYVREGHTARTLVRAADLRVVLIALREGNVMSEHHANATASVHVLSGHIRLQLPDKVVELGAGELLVLGSGLPHDVHAQTESTFLLTLGWPANH
jgi:quercetin dioxygenase-like cupin family protein